MPIAVARLARARWRSSRSTPTGRRGGDHQQGQEIPRRAIVVSMVNDGVTPVTLVTAPPAPLPGNIFYYPNMTWPSGRVGSIPTFGMRSGAAAPLEER